MEVNYSSPSLETRAGAQREGLDGIAAKVEAQKYIVRKFGIAGGQSVLVHFPQSVLGHVDDALGVGVDKKCPWWAGCSEVTTLRHPRWSGTEY